MASFEQQFYLENPGRWQALKRDLRLLLLLARYFTATVGAASASRFAPGLSRAGAPPCRKNCCRSARVMRRDKDARRFSGPRGISQGILQPLTHTLIDQGVSC